MTPVIRLHNLSKQYGKGENSVQALVDINLDIQPGQVYGFLGPNGAGKTTTIRLLVGLIYPTDGEAYIFEQNVHQNPIILRRVGSLVEDATFYNFMSGRDNLELLSRTSGTDPKRIDMLLDQVGITSNALRNVGEYSTGMKQRLGIAAALLGDPELIIFDEPTNGLDPKGRQEMRAFIRGLASQGGRTVFLSSHLLHEVEQVCDRVAIINHGRIVREGPVEQLLSGDHAQLRIQATPLDETIHALEKRWTPIVDGEWITLSIKHGENAEVVDFLVAHQIRVHQVMLQRTTLEEFFIDVISEGDEQFELTRMPKKESSD
jgi:ABC-2 type transport system ATP-binding protein